MKILEISGLSVTYGPLVALQHVDLDICSGSILGLIGLNGAGKTSLIKACLGFLPVQCEKMLFCDPRDHRRWDITCRGFIGEKRIVSRVGHLSERFQAIDTLTPWEYLYFTARSYGFSRSEAELAVEQAVADLRMQDDQHRRCGELSKGTQQKVGIARSLISNPEIVLLDEPTTSLDPESRRDLMNLIQRLARENGKSFLISSHVLSELSGVCDEFCFLREGRLWDRFASNDLPSKAQRLLHVQLAEASTADPANLPRNPALEFSSHDQSSHCLIYRIVQESFDAAAYLREVVFSRHQVTSFHIVRESLDDWFLRRVVEAKMDVL